MTSPTTFAPDADRCLVIAEAGTSHQGDLHHAESLIDAAAASGVDCVKFQAVYADEILHPRTGLVALPSGSVSLYERFRMLERDESFYGHLKRHAENRGLLFLCSAFGPRSADMLEGLGVVAHKIASPELNHTPLLCQIAKYGKPTLLSTGVSTLRDIAEAVQITGRLSIILHCVTSYPAPAEEYNLRVIASLRAIFGVPVGVSDHSADPLLVPCVAAALGARCVEKHLTLSRTTDGLDDPIALEPDDFAAMTAAVRDAEAGGQAALKKMREEFGTSRVEAVLGDGIKRLAPSEAGHYNTTNRSIHALRDIRTGEEFTPGNTTIVRSEKNLRPGIPPRHHEWVMGHTARRDVPAGQGITWEDV